ncbi:uncharacterized protein EV154DRAFT_492928 [Mucor mucedo]|uniref:uncharacterized protein n=1 Tax=Mucor mucedo TaxID=29922 RepID=UPI00221F221D|nr:uncharacterized protein EV154DRAFT_492928 [Mucor mucedo]KAI7896283.1 hypothetical protein EV154DRAFT_492928 [Mucor mucedo]
MMIEVFCFFFFSLKTTTGCLKKKTLVDPSFFSHIGNSLKRKRSRASCDYTAFCLSLDDKEMWQLSEQSMIPERKKIETMKKKKERKKRT